MYSPSFNIFDNYVTNTQTYEIWYYQNLCKVWMFIEVKGQKRQKKQNMLLNWYDQDLLSDRDLDKEKSSMQAINRQTCK